MIFQLVVFSKYGENDISFTYLSISFQFLMEIRDKKVAFLSNSSLKLSLIITILFQRINKRVFLHNETFSLKHFNKSKKWSKLSIYYYEETVLFDAELYCLKKNLSKLIECNYVETK